LIWIATAGHNLLLPDHNDQVEWEFTRGCFARRLQQTETAQKQARRRVAVQHAAMQTGLKYNG
jgi:hypothetical protein